MPLFLALPVAPLIICNDGASLSGSVSATLTANRVYLYAFELQVSVTVLKARYRTGATTTGACNMAIYTFAGNLVAGTDTGAQTNVASTTTDFTYTAFNLGPGQFYLALACNNGTDTILATNLAGSLSAPSHERYAANALAAGAMPSTLGAITNNPDRCPGVALLLSGGLT